MALPQCNATNPQDVRVVERGALCRPWYLEHERQQRPIDMKTVFGETVTS